MQTFLIIEKLESDANDISNFLAGYKYKIVTIHDLKKGLEMAKSTLPDLIIIGVESNDRESIAAMQNLRRDPITKEIPIIPTILSNDRTLLETIRKLGIYDYFVKPINKVKLIEKIKASLIQAKEQKKDNILFRKHHIVVENPTESITIIAFKSGMKYVLPEMRNIFNPEFLKSIANKNVSLDIRDIQEMVLEELKILEKIVTVFGGQKISIIAGKHLGYIIATSELEDIVNLFLSLEDYVSFLKNNRN
jgi:response regulator RpfG family c-di-GMP phosphodiesterase